MNCNFRVLIILLVVLSTQCFGSDSILVDVGNIKITADEFKDRFEFVPQLGEGNKEELEARKRKFLYSLIAEKLWALEAENLGLDSSEIMNSTYKAVEKIYVRDALYSIEIKNKIEISAKEIEEGMKRILTKLHLKVIESKNKNEITAAYNLLESGLPFDSVSIAAGINSHPVEVVYGQLYKPVEDVVYNLAAGEYSIPLESEAGSLVFYLNKKEQLPSDGVQSTINKIEKILQDKKEDSLYLNFMNEMFLDKRIIASGYLIQIMAEKITEILKEKISNENIPEDKPVYFEDKELSKLKTALGNDTLNMPLINFEFDPLSVKEFLLYLNFESFSVDSVDFNLIFSKLNSRIKTAIEQELLSREGYRRGLQNLPDVKSFLNMWRQSYLAKVLQLRIADSSKASDDEVYEYYTKLNDSENSERFELNVIEILTDSLETVEKVLNELREGKDFGKLASVYSKRELTKNTNGEFGYFNESMHGEIGRIASQMEIGSIYGPLEVPEGYSIFKLIGKRELNKDSLKDFEEVKEELHRELVYKKLRTNFIDYTAGLAHKHGVKIYEQLYNTLQVNDWKVITFRYMGFGGRIIAMPVVFPFYEWSHAWEEKTGEAQ